MIISYYQNGIVLGCRPMAGHTALDRGIGVRIPAPQQKRYTSNYTEITAQTLY